MPVTTSSPASIQTFGAQGSRHCLGMDQQRNGTLWVLMRDIQSAATFYLRFSDDNGFTWKRPSVGADLTATIGATGGSSYPAAFYIDADDYAHIAYIDTNQTTVQYRRGTPVEGGGWQWSSAFNCTGMTYGTGIQSLDIIAFYENTTWKVVIVINHPNDTAAIRVIWLDVTQAGVISIKTTTAGFGTAGPGVANAPKPARVDFSSYDGKVPDALGQTNVFVGWLETVGTTSKIRMVGYVWASANTWTPSATIDIFTQTPTVVQGFGMKFWQGNPSPNCYFVFSSDGINVISRRRDKANTATLTNDPPVFSTAPGQANIASLDLVGNGTAGVACIARTCITPYSRNLVTMADLHWNLYNGAWGSWASSTNARYKVIALPERNIIAAKRAAGVDNTLAIAAIRLGNPDDLDSFEIAEYMPLVVTGDQQEIGYTQLIAPTPDDGATVDVESGFTIAWQYLSPQRVQQAYSIRRRRIDSITGWEYWTGSAWSIFETSIVSTTANYVVFAASLWDSTYTYRYGVAVHATGLARGRYADRIIVGERPLTNDFTVFGQAGQTSLNPVLPWALSRAIQKTYQLKVYTSTQYGAAGFDPATTVPVYDSGVVADSFARSHYVQFPLISGTTYKHYVQITTETGQASTWTASTGTYVPNPAVTLQQPTVTAVADSPNNRIAVAIQTFDNKLSDNQSTVEYDTSGFEVQTNCVIARSTTQAKSGLASLRMTASSAATMSARTLAGKFIPAVVGQSYKAMASFRSAVTGRSCNVKINWYDSGGTFLSASAGSNVTDTTAGWTIATVSATAPASTAYAAVVFEVVSPANAEQHFVDEIALFPGAPANWSKGGFVQVGSVFVEASDDAGTTYKVVQEDLVVSSGDGKINFYDHSFLSGVSRTYRVRAAYIPQGFASPYSSTSAATATLSTWTMSYRDTDGVIKVIPIKPLGQTLQFTAPETGAFFEPLGRSTKVRITDAIKGNEFTLSVVFESNTEYLAFENVREQMKPIVLVTDFGDTYCLAFDSPRKVTLVNTISQLRYVDIKFVTVKAPEWFRQ